MEDIFLKKIEKIIDDSNSLLYIEKQKNNKDDILIFFISLSRYLIDIKKVGEFPHQQN